MQVRLFYSTLDGGARDLHAGIGMTTNFQDHFISVVQHCFSYERLCNLHCPQTTEGADCV